jgi:antitoxin PrlF
MITSKLASRARTTVPQPVRVALRLREGDELAYEIDGEQVVLTRVDRIGVGDDPYRMFEEWHSESDAKAYGWL